MNLDYFIACLFPAALAIAFLCLCAIGIVITIEVIRDILGRKKP